jgi:exo-beta-1,3-glucanase (GH17 family)
MHGLCFSPYGDGQRPGDLITEAQIRRRLEIIAPYIKWILSFSCTEENDLIPKLAKEYGLKTLFSAWLGDDKAQNEKEITSLIKLGESGLIDITVVGNETLVREE